MFPKSVFAQIKSLNRCAVQCRLAPLVCLAVAVFGCGTHDQEATTESTSDVGLPVISGSQLSEYLFTSDSPVLVEFGVDFNCSRCAQTRNDVVLLRESLRGDVDVIRVDFNSNAQVIAELGGTICPTYVLFEGANDVLTRSFPVSIDLLEGEVLRRIGE